MIHDNAPVRIMSAKNIRPISRILHDDCGADLLVVLLAEFGDVDEADVEDAPARLRTSGDDIMCSTLE
jgi:hypothetical protein